MAVAATTRKTIQFAELTAAQQKLLRCGRELDARGKPVNIDALATAMEGNASPESRAKVNGTITGLKKKLGGWPWDDAGDAIPGGSLPFEIVGGHAPPAAAKRAMAAKSAGPATVAEYGTEATAQAEREFVHSIRGAYNELPFPSQVRLKDAVRQLEDVVMGTGPGGAGR